MRPFATCSPLNASTSSTALATARRSLTKRGTVKRGARLEPLGHRPVARELVAVPVRGRRDPAAAATGKRVVQLAVVEDAPVRVATVEARREARRVRRALPVGLAARTVAPARALPGPLLGAVVGTRTAAAAAVAQPLLAGLPHRRGRWGLRRGRNGISWLGKGVLLPTGVPSSTRLGAVLRRFARGRSQHATEAGQPAVARLSRNRRSHCRSPGSRSHIARALAPGCAMAARW